VEKRQGIPPGMAGRKTNGHEIGQTQSKS